MTPIKPTNTLDLTKLANLPQPTMDSPLEIVRQNLYYGRVSFHLDEGEKSETMKELEAGDPVNIRSRAEMLRSIGTSFNQLAALLDQISDKPRV